MRENCVYLDSETAGLHSMPVLFQYAYDDGPVRLYDIWKEPVWKTSELIEHWMTKTIIGFNLAFDHFQIAKVYTIWSLLPKDWIPEEHIEAIALLEPEGRDGPAVKPAGVLDLMLHSRKGPYQSLMARGDIYIRRVPTALAYALAEELEKRVQLDSIYFARKADPDAPRWQVFDRERAGEFDPDFKDVVLRFAPAGGLKFLAEHAMGLTPKYHYEDVEPPRAWYPTELGFAPFALAISTPEKNWEVWGYDSKKDQPTLTGHAWPAKIKLFIDHWGTNAAAREYAHDDIVLTRELDKHFGYASVVDPKTGRPKAKVKPFATGLWSRYGNPIMAPDWFLDSLPSTPLDGELWAGRGKFQLCRSICGGDTPDPRFSQIKYAVYSCPPLRCLTSPGEIKNPNFHCIIDPAVNDWLLARVGSYLNSEATFEVEYAHLHELLEGRQYAFAHPQVRLPDDEVDARDAVEEYLFTTIQGGGEGVVN